MSGLTIGNREFVGSGAITTIDKQFPADGPGRIKINKHSLVQLSLIDPSVAHDAKIAFLIKNHQEVESFQILTPGFPTQPRSDAGGAQDAENTFGSDPGDRWDGWRIPYPDSTWPSTIETRFILRPFHRSPKHVQLISVMFTFAVDPHGNGPAPGALIIGRAAQPRRGWLARAPYPAGVPRAR